MKMGFEEVVFEYVAAVEDAGRNLRERVAELHGVAKDETPGENRKTVAEDNFFFEYDNYESPNMGKYQSATKEGNITGRFQNAYNILKKADARIDNRYHGPDYEFAYWIWEHGKDRIYRQKLRKK